MSTKDKELLLKDLSARLPYGVKVQDELGRINKLVIGNADLIRLYYNDFSIYGENALSLPFLRPMSSMTKEEIIEFNNIPSTKNYTIIKDDLPWDVANYKQIDWLLKNHFDFRGLIPSGLAIAVTEENNPYKE